MRRLISLCFLLSMSSPMQADTFAKIPLTFESNQGQADPRVQFLSRGNGHILLLTSTEAVLRTRHDVFRMKLVDANPASRAEGAEPQPGRSNYLIGNDPKRWRIGVANYGRVRFTEVYGGIDLVYYGKDRQLEYDWIVKPGADPSKIRLRFAGVKKMRVDRNGDLVLETSSGEIRQRKPVVYQTKEVAGRYVLRGRHEAGFEVGPYDAAKPLVIDPVLVYSSYLGGSGGDQGNAIAVDSAGNAYVTGWTESADFPTVNPAQATFQGATRAGNAGADAFVAKISADGSTLLYSTYLGGNGDDFGQGIAVNSSGDAFVTGWTRSTDFPLANAYQSHYGSLVNSYTGFVTKLNPAGNALLFSTYLGGDYTDQASAIALDTGGNAYITGYTDSSNFPTANAIQPGPNPHNYGYAFVTKMSADGSTLLYSTYLGGGVSDVAGGEAIAVDTSGNAYVTGFTSTTGFPTFHALQSTFSGSQGIFVTKINPSGSAFVYSTFLDGSGVDYVNAIAADSSGNAYVTGNTTSTNFPMVHPIAGTLAGSGDAFVTKINPAGSALVYSTYLGSPTNDIGFGIAVNAAGEAWVAGMTGANFPLVNPLPGTKHVGNDLFISHLSADGSALLFSSYVGSVNQFFESNPIDGIFRGGLALDLAGNAYMTDGAGASNFPIVNPFQTNYGGGGYDAVVVKVSGTTPAGTVYNDFMGNGRSGALLYDPSNGQSYTALSNGSGTYSYVPNLFTSGFDTLRTGDFNGDRKADIVLYNSHTALAYIGFSNGDGTFAFQSLFWSPGYNFIEAGDLNGDGKTDFALYNSSTGTMYTGISNGTGGFTYKYTLITSGYTFLRLADFTGDGKADIFLYNVATGQANLGVGDGAGGFTFHALSMSPGYNLADLGDLNGDGKMDLIVYNSANGNTATGISDGVGGLTFAPLLFSPGFTSVRLADYTGDGKADITVYNKNTAAAYFGTGNGAGNFTFQSLFWSPAYDVVEPQDVNGDGKIDIVLYNSTTTGTEYTGISNGNGTFTYTYSLWGPGKVLAR